MIKIGVIGCGKIAQMRHIPEYKANERVQIAAFYDRTLARAQKMADLHGGRAYQTWQELLEAPEIDAVSVCAPNFLHAQISINALQQGKHVLCEKPMATTMEDCERMVAVADQARRKLMIAHNQLLTPAHKLAKKLIAEQMIGSVLTFRTTFGHGGPETWSISPGPGTWFFDEQAAVMGAMGDLGVHKISLIQFLLGQRITSAYCRLVTVDKRDSTGRLIPLDDNALCLYELENKAIGTMAASWTHYGEEDNSTVLYGTKGIMKIYHHPTYALTIKLRGGETIYYDLETIQTNVQQTNSGVIDLFIATIFEDLEHDLLGRNILEPMRAVFASLESAAKDKKINIAYN